MAALKGKKTAWIVGAVVVLLALVGGALYYLTGSRGTELASSDYRALEVRDNTKRVSVNGHVEAQKTLTLSTRLTGPVSSIDVRVGDRVNTDQVVANLDVSDLEMELLAKQAQDASTDATSISQIETAERQYNQYKELLDNGYNTEINNAEAALRTAETQFDQLDRDYQLQSTLRAQWRDPQIAAQQTAVDNARQAAFSAAVNAARSGVDVAGTIQDQAAEREALNQEQSRLLDLQLQRNAAPDDQSRQALDAQISQSQERVNTLESTVARHVRGQANTSFNSADAGNQVVNAARNLDEAQTGLETTLSQVDNNLVTAQRAVADAFEAKKDAAVALEAARLNADFQLTNQQAAIDDAVRSARAARAAAGSGDEKLNKDIASAQVRAPFDGIVTNVTAQQGMPATGALLTIADDRRLIIHADLKELDIDKVKLNQRVEFTTPGTGDKKFAGKVIFVSPAASSAPVIPDAAGGGAGGAGGAGAQPSASERVNFPIEIEVTGDREGLRIGASAKTRIIIEEPSNNLSVPQSAVFDGENNEKKILVVEEKDGQQVIAEHTVTVGKESEFDVELPNTDLKKGTKVITDVERYRDMVGKTVVIAPEEEGAPSSSATTTSRPSDS